MTVVFFVEEQRIRDRLRSWNGPSFPVGFSADGAIVDSMNAGTEEVAVLLVDDLADPEGDFDVRLELTPPLTAVLHRPNVDWQINWLERIGAASRGGLSHHDENPAYEQVKALLSARTERARAEICREVCDIYGAEASLRRMEELAGWLALPQLGDEERRLAGALYDSLRKTLPREANAKLKDEEGDFKSLHCLTVEDLESAASVLVP
jgi:hypothetical protein